MTEYSDAAVAAYPDDLHDSRYGPSSSWMNDRERAAFDRGAASPVPPSAPTPDELADYAAAELQRLNDAGLIYFRSDLPVATPTPDVAALIAEAEGWDAQALARHPMSAMDTIRRLAAALRVSAPETVTTVEELDALPVGSVIFDGNQPWQKVADGYWHAALWKEGSSSARMKVLLDRTPARVLFRPTREEGN